MPTATALNRTNLSHPAMRRKIHDAMLEAVADAGREPHSVGLSLISSSKGSPLIECKYYRGEKNAFHFYHFWFGEEEFDMGYSQWIKDAMLDNEVHAVLRSSACVPPTLLMPVVIPEVPVEDSSSSSSAGDWIDEACWNAIDELLAGANISWRG